MGAEDTAPLGSEVCGHARSRSLIAGVAELAQVLQPFSVHLLLSSLRGSAQKRRVAVCAALLATPRQGGLAGARFALTTVICGGNNAAPAERDLLLLIRDVLLADDNLVFDTRRDETRDG